MVQKNIIKNKICPMCNKPFETYHDGHKYCSNNCKIIASKQIVARYYQKHRIKNYKICRQCGEEFLVTKHDTVFCSDECKQLYKTINQKPELVERFCIVCGTKIITKNRNRKYCNDCFPNVLKERKRKWYQEEYKDRVTIRDYEKKQELLSQRTEKKLTAQEVRKENERLKKMTKEQREVIKQQKENEKLEKKERAAYNKTVRNYKMSPPLQRIIKGNLEINNTEEVYNLINNYLTENNIEHSIKDVYDIINSTEDDITIRIYKFIIKKSKPTEL